MLGLLDHSPDMFLDEIQDQLFHQHGIDISLATISRTLKRLGISSKKVCNDPPQTSNPFHNHTFSFPKLQQNVVKKPGVNFAGKLAKSL
jgi:transposase